MGTCSSSVKEVGKTDFPEKYVFPATAKHYDIETGGFTDVWDAITDWSNKNTPGRETFKRVLHSYMQVNVCTEKTIVMFYAGQSWVFHTRYNSHINPYRVIHL
jgi:hypothetical protein